MPVVITKEAALAAVRGAIDHLDIRRAWDEMHIVCAIEAIRRGDHDIALNHLQILRQGPTLEEAAAKPPNRTPLSRARLRALIEEIETPAMASDQRACTPHVAV